jgi:hypothetical protein
MKFSWTNASGTIGMFLLMLSEVMQKFLGCKEGADLLHATCENASFLPPEYVAYAGLVFGVAMFVGKLLRPGPKLRSFLGPTAVVVPEDKSAPGVVTPSQVASK